MGNFLKKIVATKKELLENKKTGLEELKEKAANWRFLRRHFKNTLGFPGLSIIAEIKKFSPSKGRVSSRNIKSLAELYEKACADAVSVLCEEKFFRGSPDDIKEVKQAFSGPALMKDFVISEYQIYEGLLKGADAVLLIKAILNDRDYLNLYELARKLELDVLTEVHSLDELKGILRLHKPGIIGVNARDLNSFKIEPRLHLELVKEIPAGTGRVAESGIKTRARAKELKEAGYDALLIGESIASSPDPAGKITEFKNI